MEGSTGDTHTACILALWERGIDWHVGHEPNRVLLGEKPWRVRVGVYRSVKVWAGRRTVTREKQLPSVCGVEGSDGAVPGEDTVFRVFARDKATEAGFEEVIQYGEGVGDSLV